MSSVAFAALYIAPPLPSFVPVISFTAALLFENSEFLIVVVPILFMAPPLGPYPPVYLPPSTVQLPP